MTRDIPKPFLEHQLETFGWPNILSMITICTNDIDPTFFCNEEGYDVVPLPMVNVLLIKDKIPLKPKPQIKPLLETHIRHVHVENKICTFSRSS